MTETTIAETRRGRVLEQLRADAPHLSPAERRVADVVIADPAAIIHLSVTEVAELAETSAASVVRMCTSLGLRGFQELKILLARETSDAEQPSLEQIDAGDGARQVVLKIMHGTGRALERTADALDHALLDAVVDALLGARRVLFGAVGTSAPLAADISYRLATIGIDASFLADVHAQHVSARMLRTDDVFFTISHTGSTFETLAAAKAAKAAGARVIVLTSFTRSPLTEFADHVIVAGSPETAYRVEAMASRIVHLTVLDAIHVLLSLRSPDAAAAQALTADVLIEHRH